MELTGQQKQNLDGTKGERVRRTIDWKENVAREDARIRVFAARNPEMTIP